MTTPSHKSAFSFSRDSSQSVSSASIPVSSSISSTKRSILQDTNVIRAQETLQRTIFNKNHEVKDRNKIKQIES